MVASNGDPFSCVGEESIVKEERDNDSTVDSAFSSAYNSEAEENSSDCTSDGFSDGFTMASSMEPSTVRTPSVGSFSVQTPSVQSMNTMQIGIDSLNEPKDSENLIGSSVGGNEVMVFEDEDETNSNNDIDGSDEFDKNFISEFSNKSVGIVHKRSLGLATIQSRNSRMTYIEAAPSRTTLNTSTVSKIKSTNTLTTGMKPPVAPSKTLSIKSRQAASRLPSKLTSGLRTRSTKSMSPIRERTSSNKPFGRLSSRSRSRGRILLNQSKGRTETSQSTDRLGLSKSKSKNKADRSLSSVRVGRSKSTGRFRSLRSQAKSVRSGKTKESFSNGRERSNNCSILESVDVEEALSLSLHSTNTSPLIPLDVFLSQTPPVTSGKGGMLKSKKGKKNVSKNDLKLRQQVERFLETQKYDKVVTIIQQNPRLVGIQYNQPYGRTLLHVIANQRNPIPENVVLKIMSHNTSIVAMPDDNANTPLHYAAKNLNLANMHLFVIFLKFHPIGASERNIDGDLPLHIVAANPCDGADEGIHLLLEVNPKGISEPNNKGKIPLHLALSEGSANIKSIQDLVRFHKFKKCGVTVLDNRGNSPLHCAILNGTKYQAIQVFNDLARDSFLSSFTQEDEEGNLPLHIALMKKHVDPLVLLSLIHAAPFTGGMPNPRGQMPIALATRREMSYKVIKVLLASDLPIELGNVKNGNIGMGCLVKRDHGHSWWHVAVECREKYVDIVHSLLSDKANFIQIIALARSLGPDNKTMTFQAASASLESIFKNLLRFYYRYELLVNKDPIINNDVQSFSAIDHGKELQVLEVTGPWLNDGFTTVKGPRTKQAVNKGQEVSYSPWQTKQRDVTLRCYGYDDAFEAELSIRKKYDMTKDFVEGIVHDHRVPNYVNASFTTGKLLCIAFERNDTTLHELLDGSRAKHNWLVKCHLILNDLANALEYLHQKCLIHGNLDPMAIAKFTNKWKLLDIGNSTDMGKAMGGILRKSVPPEAIVKAKTKDKAQNLKEKKRRTRKLASNNSLHPKVSIQGVNKTGKSRKKFGFFVFNMDELGLRKYGETGLSSKLKTSSFSSDISSKEDMSKVDVFSAHTDEGSLRIIAMQEDEICRLRKALEEKEHIYRKQLAEERLTFKLKEIERQRELQKENSGKKVNAEGFLQFVPEKVMASPIWDIWGVGLIMAQLLLGKTKLLPCNADTDEEFLEAIVEFDDIKVSAISEEVREVAGDLAADLVARLLHPKPQQRIGTVSKMLQHKYFREAFGTPANESLTVSKVKSKKVRKTRKNTKKHGITQIKKQR